MVLEMAHFTHVQNWHFWPPLKLVNILHVDQLQGNAHNTLIFLSNTMKFSPQPENTIREVIESWMLIFMKMFLLFYTPKLTGGAKMPLIMVKKHLLSPFNEHNSVNFQYQHKYEQSHIL